MNSLRAAGLPQKQNPPGISKHMRCRRVRHSPGRTMDHYKKTARVECNFKKMAGHEHRKCTSWIRTLIDSEKGGQLHIASVRVQIFTTANERWEDVDLVAPMSPAERTSFDQSTVKDICNPMVQYSVREKTGSLCR